MKEEMMERKNVVAFLDLLGFSSLLKKAPEIAFDNLNAFHNSLKTRYMDDKEHPVAEYEKNLRDFSENRSVSSFKDMIAFGDSLVLGGEDPDLFVRQVGNYVADLYIRYSAQFAKMSMDAEEITSIRSELFARYESGKIEYDGSFPILFRGGVALGEEIFFWDEFCIRNGELKNCARNVGGRTYLEAVTLEKMCSGPRLLCHKNFVDSCREKQYFARVCDVKECDMESETKEEVYEVLWPMMGCECGQSSGDATRNIGRSVMETMLPPALNLYIFFKAKPKSEDLVRHYKALNEVVIKGIIKYGEKKGKEEYARELIEKYLKKQGGLDFLDVVCE